MREYHEDFCNAIHNSETFLRAYPTDIQTEHLSFTRKFLLGENLQTPPSEIPQVLIKCFASLKIPQICPQIYLQILL